MTIYESIKKNANGIALGAILGGGAAIFNGIVNTNSLKDTIKSTVTSAASVAALSAVAFNIVENTYPALSEAECAACKDFLADDDADDAMVDESFVSVD